MQTVLAKQRAQRAAQRLAEGKPYTDEDDTLDQTITPNKLRDINALVLEYKRKYVTLQQDRSEDDLSYIKLINYGEQARGVVWPYTLSQIRKRFPTGSISFAHE
eukprot:1901317-Pleurochrysis_carterae.AAC.1